MRNPKYRSLLLAVCLALFATCPVFAAEIDRTVQVIQVEEAGDTYWVEMTPGFTRLRERESVVAVALGGGGARALVNVGVLKALEEEGIPVDLVVGTSMGAVIAVMYGSGIPVAEIERVATAGILPETIDFNIPFFQSLLSADRLNGLIERLAPVKNLEDFPVPTALLSMDLTNEVRYIHTTGQVSRVLRHVYTIPFLFPLYKGEDGAFRIDPGMMELTPALAARILDADLVIATTAYDALSFSEYNTPLRAFRKLIEFVKENNTKKIVESYSDIIINHDVGDYSFNDFHLAEEFIALGYRETKKMIPQIKAKLAAKGIALRPAGYDHGHGHAKNELEDLTAVLHDYRYGRVLGEKTIRAGFYYGREHALFHSRYFLNRLPAAQYGLLVDTGRVELSFYATAGTHSRRLSDPRGETLEVKGRYKKLSPAWDFACLAAVTEEKTDYQALFIRYTDWGQLGLGAARLSGTDYAYLQQIYGLNLGEIRLDGDLHLFAPLGKDGAHLRENEYCFTGELRAPLGGKWAFLSRLVLAETDYTPTPRIYRGFPAGDPPKYQAALEVLYDHRFSYSKEVLGFIQWTGVEFFQFLEGEGIKDFSLATGCGFRAAYRIIGIKPLYLGGYLSYDFLRASAGEEPVQAVLTVDIAI
jgi:NTE family protein